MKKKIVAAALGATALSAIMPIGVAAQSAQTAMTTERFDIPAGPLVEALQAWSKITKRQIVYRMEDVGGKQTDGLRGDYSALLALQGLLLHTGLKMITTEDGAVALRPLAGDEIDTSATPDILVKGRRNWTLNTGIERTQDDSQPFIVMDRKEIERSGAPNLEAFLRNQLNVNTSSVSGDQKGAGGTSAASRIGLSNINLRGIGSRDTLILIDGRRQPGINMGDGNIGQPSITGIPIAAVERIEVLASSASGIYGSGASGGVINIILRRDFKGGELSLNYDNTSDFKQGRGTIDLVAGVPLEHGRTRVSLTANWTKSDPLLYSARNNLRERGLNTLLANDPDAFYGTYAYPPQGTTPNYLSQNGQPLQLKPAYGGQTLSSMYGTVPAGYAGLQTSGIAPLLAGIGQYNLQQPNTASGYGRRAALIYPLDQYSGSLAVRREFSSWLSAYAEVGLQHSSGINTTSNTVAAFTLRASAPNNPFTQSVLVVLPGDPRYDVTVKSTAETIRTLGGAIVRLPYGWQAVAELAYSKSRSTVGDSPAAPDSGAYYQLASGALNGLSDVLANPLAIPFYNTPYYTRLGGGDSSNLAPSLRLAGPLPVTLPGGKVRMTINTEINDQKINGLRTTVLTPDFPFTQYIPDGRQVTRSIYAEAVFPLVGDKHQLPLIKLLELRVSARHEAYKGEGGDPLTCYPTFVSGQYDYFGECPGEGDVVNRSSTRNSHTDPSISMRWQPTGGITLRASYTTGYLPPRLSQLVRRLQPTFYIGVTDTARGGEAIGTPQYGSQYIPAYIGGNPDVKPELSRTLTAGVIFEPQFIDGLRFSVDWTRIKKSDVYFSPAFLTSVGYGGSQAQFDQFLKVYPDRVVRGAPSDGYSVGKIQSLDLSLANLKAMSTEAYDFTFNYDNMLFGGNLSLIGRATYTDSLVIQPFADSPAVDYAGVVPYGYVVEGNPTGALRFRGSLSAQWSKDALSFGWQTRYMSGYYLRTDRAVVLDQGSARVDSQMYHDLNVTYKFPFKATLRFGINNVFNTKPPVDATQSPLYYSAYGDPRLRSFYLGISKSF